MMQVQMKKLEFGATFLLNYILIQVKMVVMIINRIEIE